MRPLRGKGEHHTKVQERQVSFQTRISRRCGKDHLEDWAVRRTGAEVRHLKNSLVYTETASLQGSGKEG
jgi:hypothetical protein